MVNGGWWMVNRARLFLRWEGSMTALKKSIPYSLFPIPYSLFPIPYSLFPIPYPLFPNLCPIP